MWLFYVLAVAALSSLVPGQRSPASFEGETIRFEAEQDAFFADTDEPNERPRRRDRFKIRDFRFETSEFIPKPKQRHRGPPPRPGERFPPAPGGSWRPPQRELRICEQKYAEYMERIFPNDSAVVADANDVDFDGRILARPGEYPHMVAVGFESSSQQIEYKCGGSLISESFVLTAAHCTELNGDTPKWARIGDLNLLVDERNVEPQVLAISEIFNHDDYNKDYYYNDIALLRLERHIILTEFVRPIRLWTHAQLPTSIAFAMGYGSTAFAKPMTNRLTDLNLTIVTNEECNKDLPALSEAPNGVIGSQICGQDYILNRDTCQGDSGGPLQLNLPGRRRRAKVHYHLVGITSYGVFCRSSYPSVYTRVHSFLDWIERLVWNDD